MTDTRRRAFMRTTAAGLAASTLACRGLSAAASQSEEFAEPRKETKQATSDVRLKAMTMVPHGKFCFGSDSSCPESIVGTGEISREVIANVLEDLIARLIIDEKVALGFIEHTYVKTPTRLFQL